MPRTKYFFNPKSLSFEKVSDNRRYVVWRTIGLSSLIIVSVITLSLIFSQLFTEPYQKALANDQKKVQTQLRQMQREVEDLNAIMEDLREKDVQIYRAIYGVAPPKPINLKEDSYHELMKLNHGSALVLLRKKLDEIKLLSDQQDKSYATLEKLITKREQMVNSIPAIMPVANKDLKRMASGFGYRLDPFYHTFSFHGGMDFTAEVGTEVYATGDGVVAKLLSERWSYGNHIIINHGYGYTTVYAHLSRFAVKPGTKVKRGQLIGYVGSTGRSTGPHLHYEVRKNDNPLNPAFFYRNDLSDEEYARMLELSQREANRFD